jgi:hypothetical protein
MKKILIDRQGMQIKMPKNRAELAALLDKAVRENKQHIEDHVLYLQGKPNRTYGRSLASVNEAPMQDAPRTGQELKDSVCMTIQRLGDANAQIATSLAKILERMA